LIYKKGWATSFYTYKGSDTIPPCNEDVRWIIYEQPFHISTLLMDRMKVRLLGD